MQGQGKELGAAFHGAKTQLVDDSQMLGSWGTKSVVLDRCPQVTAEARDSLPRLGARTLEPVSSHLLTQSFPPPPQAPTTFFNIPFKN